MSVSSEKVRVIKVFFCWVRVSLRMLKITLPLVVKIYHWIENYFIINSQEYFLLLKVKKIQSIIGYIFYYSGQKN